MAQVTEDIRLNTSQMVQELVKLNQNLSQTQDRVDGIGGSMGAVGLAAKLNIAGVVVQAFGMMASAITAPFRGLKDAMMNTEKQLAQLRTALGSTDKAFATYQKAVEVAATTPFNVEEVIGSVTQMQAYGIAAFDPVKKKTGEVVKDIKGQAVSVFDAVANVAAATALPVSQAMEAYADAIMGEWERFKQFGVKKDLIPGLAGLTAGTAEYKRVLDEWLATNKRFANAVQNSAGGLGQMLSNLSDLFTNFTTAVGGVADKEFRLIDEKAVKDALGVFTDPATGKEVTRNFQQMFMSVADLSKKYGISEDYQKKLEGLTAGTKEYGNVVRDALGESQKFNRETVNIGRAITFYDAVRLSVREIYDAFTDATSGVNVLGRVIGQYMAILWRNFVYPIFVVIGDLTRSIAKFGEDLIGGVAKIGTATESAAQITAGRIEKLMLGVAIDVLWFKTFVLEEIGKALNEMGINSEFLMSALEALAIVLAVKLAPAILKVAKAFGTNLYKLGMFLVLTTAVDLITRWDELTTAGKALEMAVIALGLAFAAISNWGTITAAVGAVTTAFTVLAAVFGVTVGTVALVAAGVVALIAGLVLLVVYWDEVKAAFSSAVDYMDKKLEEWGVYEFFRQIGDWISTYMINPIKEAAAALEDFFGIGKKKQLENQKALKEFFGFGSSPTDAQLANSAELSNFFGLGKSPDGAQGLWGTDPGSWDEPAPVVVEETPAQVAQAAVQKEAANNLSQASQIMLQQVEKPVTVNLNVDGKTAKSVTIAAGAAISGSPNGYYNPADSVVLPGSRSGSW